jgi:TDG/mug DNA glycosylase family protein
VIFRGINPSRYSAAVKHHFARPGNRFWTTLHAAGFTSQLLLPSEEREFLVERYALTNLAGRASAAADGLPAMPKQGIAAPFDRIVRPG